MKKTMLPGLVKDVVISMSDSPKIHYFGGCDMDAMTFFEDHSKYIKQLVHSSFHKGTYVARTGPKCSSMHPCQILQKCVRFGGSDTGIYNCIFKGPVVLFKFTR